MIGVKEAVDAAMEAIARFYVGRRLRELDLEEVELAEDEKHWLITLGFDTQKTPPNDDLRDLLPTRYERRYKQFRVDAETGRVEAMKIRQV